MGIEPTKGSYVWDKASGELNLQPITSSIPDDQRKVQLRWYDSLNVLRGLKRKGAFRTDPELYKDFERRLVEAATVGCTGVSPSPHVALDAFEQIRGDIVSHKREGIVNRYLTYLAGWVVGGMILGGIVEFIARSGISGLSGYGWVVMGSMAGSWLSLAMRRREVSFEELRDFLDVRNEPFVRLLSVGGLAAIVALCLQLDVFSISFAKVIEFSKFPAQIHVAFLLGLIAGVGERVLSRRLFGRMSEA